MYLTILPQSGHDILYFYVIIILEWNHNKNEIIYYDYK